jgi:hypothetical protein
MKDDGRVSRERCTLCSMNTDCFMILKKRFFCGMAESCMPKSDR